MTALLLFAVLLLVLLNAFFVIAEYALVRTRRAKLEAARRDGAKNAVLALHELDEISDHIAACQVGITMASIGIGALGEPTVADLLKPVFGGPLSHGIAVFLAGLLAYALITSVHITIGELVPKVYAIDRSDRLILRIARPLHWSRIVFHPFIVVLTAVADRILKLLGVDPDRVSEDERTSDELKVAIAESLQGGQLDPGEAGMLSGVFHLHEQEARQVMTPIPAVVTADVSEDVETALRRCISSGHTRLVVTEDENQDHVRGFVHANALARQLLSEGPRAPVKPLVRPAPFIPETKPLDDLLAELQRQRISLAVVIDEYGRTAGVVTVEDIVEEVVGEITDETDPAGGAVRRLANGDWFVRGHVAITDLVDYGLELPLDTDAYNSVGGFVFAQLGRLPKRGDTVTADGYSIRVESVRENRVEAVRIRERRPSGAPTTPNG